MCFISKTKGSLFEKYWDAFNGEYVDLFVWDEASKSGCKPFRELIRVFDNHLQEVRLVGGKNSTPVNTACLLILGNGPPEAV